MDIHETVPPSQPAKKRTGLKRIVYFLLFIGLLFVAWITIDYFRTGGLEVFQTQDGILVSGQEDAREEITREMSLQGRTLVFEGDLSDITIVGEKTELASFKFIKDAWGSTETEARNRLRDVEIIEDGDSTMYRFIVNPEPGYSMVHLTATVPIQTELNVDINNANIRLQSIEGSITIHNKNGRIEITGAASRIDVETLNGSINAGFRRLEAGTQVRAQTRNGGITLALPENISAGIEASTRVGTVTILDLEPVEQRMYRTMVGGRYTASLGTGTNSIELTAEHGDILLHRAQVEALPVDTDVPADTTLENTMPEVPDEEIIPAEIPADTVVTDIQVPPDTSSTVQQVPDGT